MDETSAELPGAAEAREDAGGTAPAGILRAGRAAESEPGTAALLSAFANSHGSHGPAERARAVAADRRVALDAGFSTMDAVVPKRRSVHHAASLPTAGARAGRPETSSARRDILRSFLQDDGQRGDEDSTGDHSLYGTRVAGWREDPAKQTSLKGGVRSIAHIAARWTTKVEADPGRPPDDVAAAGGGSLEQDRASLSVACKASGRSLLGPEQDGTNDAGSAQVDTDRNGPSKARPRLNRTSSMHRLRTATKTMIASRGLQRENANKRLWERTRRGKQKVAWHEEIYHMDSRVMANATNFSIVASLVDVCFLMCDVVGFHGCSQACRQAGGRFDPNSSEFRGHLGSTFLALKLFCGIVADLCHITFVVVGFRTVRNRSRVGEEEHAEQRARAVAMKYAFSRFPIDIIGCAPFYWIFIDNPWCRANRILNVLINSYSKDEAAKWLVYLRIQASVNLLNLTIFLILLFVYVHSMTCITMILAWSWLSGDGEGSTVELRRWLDIDDTDSADTTNFVFFYFHCSLWVWSNVSGWGGNWSPHTPITSGWTYANQLLGVFLYMYLFGEIVNILHSFDLASAEFSAERDKITTFLQIREMPAELQLRVHKYLDEVWRLKHGVEEHELLAQLPSFLRHDLAWFLNQQFLEKMPMFNDAGTSALLEINRHLILSVATEGELLAHEGELTREMHFILSGEVHILNDQGRADIELFEGAIIGEVCLVFDMPSPFDAEVIRTANLFTLAQDNFFDIAAKFPALVKRIHSRGRAIFGERWSEWEEMARKIHEQHDDEVGEKDFQFHGTLGRSHSFDLGSNGIARTPLGEQHSVADVSKARQAMRAGILQASAAKSHMPGPNTHPGRNRGGSVEGGAGRDSDSLRPTALSSLAPLPPPSPHVGGGRGRGSGGGDNHELIRKVELVLQQFQNIEEWMHTVDQKMSTLLADGASEVGAASGGSPKS